MGGCIGINRNDGDTANGSSLNVSRPLSGNLIGGNGGPPRKNHPLCHETIRWKSDVPLTEGQLRSKRDEFWDTAPAFDGRKEIWDALRAATVAAEALDFQLSQAILDGANISVPNGYLTECYDELGTQYKVPIYCLSYPINIVKEDNGRDSPAEYSEPVDGGIEVILKLRLSSSFSDTKLTVYSKDTIGQCKKKLQAQENVDACCQRWFYSGKLLGDKMLIEDAQIQPQYIVQVIVNTEHYNHGVTS
ncbi:ubiquitin domain-containing protein 1 isoform X1 [Contarinia nasturtii]|uniref:ubiquitin domain-containing protein 1 isoform X1 n=1 Tax=Contarinia nasturtii TaxID=265458 RepID=UPI0012D48CF5|nr:ubiquitin domain-containing protein 1 isoform X1 [Contarinia nasturtii]XP_031625837.1 ubiquitin domain-containing protein 1 isoform X1 [Contarinia nasturtii]